MNIRNYNYHYLILAFAFCILLLHIVALSTYGVNVPYWDDWRSLLSGHAGAFTIGYLFQSANDTMGVTGLFFDSLAIRYLSGNNYIYQILSMTLCLGSLFLLQIALLNKFTKNKLILSFSYLTIIFMLQPGSYWGLQSIAFHQALPLIGILLILYILISRSIKSFISNTIVIAVIAAITGFSYISGAIAITAMTIWIYLLSFYTPSQVSRSYLSTGTGLLIGTLLSLPAQLHVILVVQSGKTHRPDAPWALPSDIDFWMYLLGKISRAFGFLGSEDPITLIITFIIFLFSILCFTYLLYIVFRKKANKNLIDLDLLCVYGTIFLSIFLYLFIVSAGRANLRPDSISSPLQIFSFGQLRFHFFWVTILIPWLALVLGKLVFEYFIYKTSVFITCTLFLALLIHSLTIGNIYNHSKYYQKISIVKTNGLACLKEKSKRGEKINCPDIYPGDITNALKFAKDLGLSFTEPTCNPPRKMKEVKK